MSDLPHRFTEDRALRDAARAVFLADLAHARGALSRKGLRDRLIDWLAVRIGAGAKDAAEVAVAGISANRTGIAVLVAALVLWFSRDAITQAIGVHLAETAERPEGETDNAPEVSADHPAPQSSAAEEPLPHPTSGESDVR